MALDSLLENATTLNIGNNDYVAKYVYVNGLRVRL